MTVSFTFADKPCPASVLSAIFPILYANMSVIAPTGDTYEQDLALWRENMLSAMEKEERQLVLISCGGTLAGYFQYHIQGDTWMMEEIQIAPPYQGTGLFRQLYQWLERQLPPGLAYVEAYSHKSNHKSQGILEHLGLRKTGENQSGSCWHYRGAYATLWEAFRQP